MSFSASYDVDIAKNYLGFYSNTMSGVVAYSSIEKNQLYYIIKYNDNMDMDLSLLLQKLYFFCKLYFFTNFLYLFESCPLPTKIILNL